MRWKPVSAAIPTVSVLVLAAAALAGWVLAAGAVPSPPAAVDLVVYDLGAGGPGAATSAPPAASRQESPGRDRPAVVAALPAGSGLDPVCAKPLPLPSKIGVPAFRDLLDDWVEKQCWIQLGWGRDQACRNAEEVHGSYVVNYYSPQAYEWLAGGRQGEIADGEMIVKTMWRPCRGGKKPDGTCGDRCFADVAPMFKDSAGSFDGWFWSYDTTGDDIAYPFSNTGLYCLNCHASAVSESTFASPECLEPGSGPDCAGPSHAEAAAPPEPAPDDSLHELRSTPPAERMRLPAPPAAPSPPDPAAFVKALRAPASVSEDQVVKLPGEALDHVVSGPHGPQQFLTSDQCLGCHDATSSNGVTPPNMIACIEDGRLVDCATISDDAVVYNLSPYAEEHASMMGLSGRDPVFYAQLESETVVHAPNSALVQNTCFSCHGAMGQHQLEADRGEQFRLDMVYATGDDPYAEYGALARDGVSCTVCHHIVLADSVPFEETFTGKFFCGPPDELYGPYGDDHVRVKPMEQALGITPHGETAGITASKDCGPEVSGPVEAHSDIGSAKVCGSCHTVHLPVFDSAGKEVGQVFEQSTYLEWLNSAYQDEAEPVGDIAQTCQDCHMPQEFLGKKIATRIANIEDDTFPPMRYQLPEPELNLLVREPFSRHTLVGINLFSLEMFRQYADPDNGYNEILGIRTIDPMMVWGGEIVNPLVQTLETGLELAQHETARLEILGVSRTADTLETRIRLTNLAGHHFPSGVGFRRAFLEFRVLDAAGKSLWASGGSDEFGIILGADGKPLPSEFFAEVGGEQAYQRHWQVIESQDQVQIYEELTKSPPPESRFTTSFLSLYDRVKDNRLQPRGWRKDGPWAEVTQPDGDADHDCLYTIDPDPKCAPWYAKPSTGADELTYRVPLAGLAGKPASVAVTLYYQSLPPYYQADRYGLLARCANPADPSCYPETRRLLYLASRLDTGAEIAGQRPIEGWKLQVAGVSRRLE